MWVFPFSLFNFSILHSLEPIRRRKSDVRVTTTASSILNWEQVIYLKSSAVLLLIYSIV